jgi:hypothetical protein
MCRQTTAVGFPGSAALRQRIEDPEHERAVRTLGFLEHRIDESAAARECQGQRTGQVRTLSGIPGFERIFRIAVSLEIVIVSLVAGCLSRPAAKQRMDEDK